VSRRRAREAAFQALFLAERGATPLAEAWDDVRFDVLAGDDELPAPAFGEGDLAFAERLVATLIERKGEIDADLTALLHGWTFGQMAQTDLNVLRLAMAEFALAETPPEVAIEMAVRLARRYGGEDSGRFVNGVLAKAHRRHAVAGKGA
jgi:transcription antitermination protein NusB